MENIEVLYFKEYFERVLKKYSNNKNCYTLKEVFTKPNKCGGNESLFPPSNGLVNQNEILLGIGGIILFTHKNFYILTKTGDKIFGLNKISHLRWEKSKGIFSKGSVRVEPVEIRRHNIEDEKVVDIVNEIKNDIPGIFLKIRWETERLEKERREEEERNRIEKEKSEKERREKEEIEKKEKEKIRLEKLELSKFDYISKLDKDGNGEIDLTDCDSFTKLLNKKQKNIIEIDKNYIQNFVKISIYLKTKKSNIQKLFQRIQSVKNQNELEELVGLLQNQVHTYNLLIFHSINMVISLTESDLITFYEIYECFDKLGVFNSNWENEVSSNLQNINSSIDEVNQSIINLDNSMSNNLQKLMYSINDMEGNIVNSINKLTYITEDSFSSLNHTVGEQLSDINSSLNFNNLLTGIQTYQMYKINQNTKRIN